MSFRQRASVVLTVGPTLLLLFWLNLYRFLNEFSLRSSNPTPEENHYLTVTWLPVSKDNLYYLNLGNELSLGTNPDGEKMDFWTSLYSKYYKLWDHPKVNNEEVPRKEPEIIPEVQETTIIHEPDVVDSAPEPTEIEEPKVVDEEPKIVQEEPKANLVDTVLIQEEAVNQETNNGSIDEPELIETVEQPQTQHMNGNGIDKKATPRTSNEIKMVQNANGTPKDVIRANDPPEDDLPKNIGVNKFVNFFESLGGKK